eukprot:TRINITY_DN3947_c0_g1_i1.p1 TRINITY_DN3947_c0_g1~~TRINITY_DN3947_c0_g1_i1.p1  ORF type:complete len:217 (-),score=36.65 TRINITY_DN3947_c0_g1_i1:189-839(-)
MNSKLIIISVLLSLVLGVVSQTRPVFPHDWYTTGPGTNYATYVGGSTLDISNAEVYVSKTLLASTLSGMWKLNGRPAVNITSISLYKIRKSYEIIYENGKISSCFLQPTVTGFIDLLSFVNTSTYAGTTNHNGITAAQWRITNAEETVTYLVRQSNPNDLIAVIEEGSSGQFTSTVNYGKFVPLSPPASVFTIPSQCHNPLLGSYKDSLLDTKVAK